MKREERDLIKKGKDKIPEIPVSVQPSEPAQTPTPDPIALTLKQDPKTAWFAALYTEGRWKALANLYNNRAQLTAKEIWQALREITFMHK